MASTATQTLTSAPAETALLRCLRLPLVPYVFILISHLPMLVLQLRKIWLIEHYRYVPFLLAALAFLAWHRWQQIPGPKICRPTRASLAVLPVSFALLAMSQLLWSPWLGTVAAILSVLAIILSFGRRIASSVAPVCLLLWLLLPLPFGWDERFILWLQDVSSQGGSILLDYFGYRHVLAGYMIEIPGRQFLVEEACSGVQSLFTLLATAAILAVWLRRPLVHSLLLIASAAFWAIAVNVICVTLVVSLCVQSGADMGAGWQHTAFGAGLFVVELLMLLTTDRLLLFLIEPTGLHTASAEEGAPPGASAEADQTYVAREMDFPFHVHHSARLVILRFIATAFVAVGVFHAATLAYHRPSHGEHLPVARAGSGADRTPLSDVLSEGTLPQTLGAWKRAGFHAMTRSRNSDLGRHSIVWRYAGSREGAVVSVDFPFVGWHYLTGCYQARGWEIEARTVIEHDESQELLDAAFVELSMRDATARRGYMLVSQFTGAGDQQIPPATPGLSLSTWCVAARNRVLNRFVDLGAEPTTIQIQMLVTSDLPLSDEQRQQARQAFEEATRQIAKRLWPKEETP